MTGALLDAMEKAKGGGDGSRRLVSLSSPYPLRGALLARAAGALCSERSVVGDIPVRAGARQAIKLAR